MLAAEGESGDIMPIWTTKTSFEEDTIINDAYLPYDENSDWFVEVDAND